MAENAQLQRICLETRLRCDVVAESADTSLKLAVEVMIPPSAPEDDAVAPGCVIQVGELSQDWSRVVENENPITVDSLSAAIHAIIEQHGQGASAAALVISPGSEVKDTSALIAAIELLNRIDIPLYVISCASVIDHRLLSQFSTLSGGEFILLDRPEAVDEHVTAVLKNANTGVRRLGFLTIEVPAMMNIECLFTVSPQFGLIQLSQSSRPKNSISFPLLSVGDEATSREFLLSVNTPPLAAGRYHLAQLRCIKALTEQENCLAESLVSFSVSNASRHPAAIEPTVARLSEKLQLTTLVEIIAQAYLREDGGTISRTLNRIESALLRLNQDELALRIANLRVNFLHRGSFALPELNETWLVIYQASSSLMKTP